MYYLLVVCIVSLLAFAAWRYLSRRQALAQEAALSRRPAASEAIDPVSELAARLLKGPREDKPCLTPIDCVQENRCAGHCGTRG